MAGLGHAYRPDGAFIGYIFLGSPPREPRLWMLDRHLAQLVIHGIAAAHRGLAYGDPPGEIDDIVGLWSIDTDQLKTNLTNWDITKKHWTGTTTALNEMLPGVALRYKHAGDDRWEMLWHLTDTIIPHVHNFGQDDTWRLAVWPD